METQDFLKTMVTVFGVVFVAEVGDKTQLATMLFAADKQVSPWAVFAGSAAALVLASAIGVVAGAALSHLVSERLLSGLAGAGFLVMGAWTLYGALSSAG